MIWIALAVWLIVAVAVFVCLILAMNRTGWLHWTDWFRFAGSSLVWPFVIACFAASWVRWKIRGL